MDTAYGRHIPRFSKQDEKVLAEKYLDDHVTENLSFSQIYENLTMTTLVSLEENIFSRWFYNRIVTIGDSAHKISEKSYEMR